MSTCTVIINDFENDRRTVVAFGSDEFAVVEEMWEEPDKVLVGLQENTLFTGKTRWIDLDPTHYRILLMRNLTLVGELTDEQRADHENPTVRSLHFLLCAFITCLQKRCESFLELLHVNRLGETEVAYDYTACLNLAVDYPRQPKGGLRIIVDNT